MALEIVERAFAEGSMAARNALAIYFQPLSAILLVPAPHTRAKFVKRLAQRFDADLREVELMVQARLSELKEIAVSEAIVPSLSSEADLISFLRKTRSRHRPSLFLLENGNFRAVWKGLGGRQIGLQFFGEGQVQFVIFARRPEPDLIVRSCGRDTLDGILEQLGALGVDQLVYGEG